MIIESLAIGGGLAMLALAWMVREALRCVGTEQKQEPKPNAEITQEERKHRSALVRAYLDQVQAAEHSAVYHEGEGHRGCAKEQRKIAKRCRELAAKLERGEDI